MSHRIRRVSGMSPSGNRLYSVDLSRLSSLRMVLLMISSSSLSSLILNQRIKRRPRSKIPSPSYLGTSLQCTRTTRRRRRLSRPRNVSNLQRNTRSVALLTRQMSQKKIMMVTDQLPRSHSRHLSHKNIAILISSVSVSTRTNTTSSPLTWQELARKQSEQGESSQLTGELMT